ncbi:MAG: hypothetical protein JWN84_1640 [Nocardioides sp.]|nr:hypothetical protein [Nocardioides sp.]
MTLEPIPPPTPPSYPPYPPHLATATTAPCNYERAAHTSVPSVFTLKPTTLDRVAAQAIAEATTPDGECELGSFHGLEVFALAGDALGYFLGYSQAVVKSPRGQGNLQKLGGALFTYQRHFAPGPAWRLVECDADSATLTWTCTTADLPPVIDHITRTTAIAAVGSSDPGTASNDSNGNGNGNEVSRVESVVRRACDLINVENSLLRFPGEPAAARWCPADDPIYSRETAFPVAIYGEPNPTVPAYYPTFHRDDLSGGA